MFPIKQIGTLFEMFVAPTSYVDCLNALQSSVSKNRETSDAVVIVVYKLAFKA